MAVARVPGTHAPSKLIAAVYAATPITPEPYYSVDRLARLIPKMAELRALAEFPSSARGLLHSGPTQESPRFAKHQKGAHGDRNRWSDVIGDLESGWYSLLQDGTDRDCRARWTVIGHRLQGKTLAEVARTMKVRTSDVIAYHRDALERMSAFLEGETVGEDMPVESPGAAPSRSCALCGGPVHGRADARYCAPGCRQQAHRIAKARTCATSDP